MLHYLFLMNVLVAVNKSEITGYITGTGIFNCTSHINQHCAINFLEIDMVHQSICQICPYRCCLVF